MHDENCCGSTEKQEDLNDRNRWLWNEHKEEKEAKAAKYEAKNYTNISFKDNSPEGVYEGTIYIRNTDFPKVIRGIHQALKSNGVDCYIKEEELKKKTIL